MAMSEHDGARRGWAHPHLPNEGKTSEWYTPPHIFERLGLTFDLDPCAPNGGVPWVPATTHYSIEEDGLKRPWHGRVWLNPPYGKQAGAWVQRLANHGDGIALVFSRTDVRWWHVAVPLATVVSFIEGRLTFIAGAGQSAPGNSGGPSALLAYGEVCARAVERSGLGLVYRTPSEAAA
jgi:DNA N-6-adenine-methyltransferase Dam